MFIGHFAVALAAKKMDSKPSLGITFMAAQWLDLLWPVLLLTGTEKVAINSDTSAAIPLSFTYYPVSHSLLAVLGWSVLFAVLYFLFKKNLKGAVLIGTLVLSHWVLDWLVHIPDLLITPFTETKVGLGLWNYKYLELLVELLLFAGGVFLYINATNEINKKGKTVFWSLIIFLVAVHLMNVFGPPPTAVKPIAIVGLSQWVLVLWAGWADKNKVPSLKK